MAIAASVSAEVLRSVVAQVEENGPLKSMSALYAAVAAAYNNQDDVPADISAAIAAARIKDLAIETKTQPAKRSSNNTAFPVDMSKFLAVIVAVEADGPLENLSTLYDAVAERYNKDLPEAFHITGALASARIKERGLTLKTQGKKGRAKGSKVERNVLMIESSEGAVESINTVIAALIKVNAKFTYKPVENGVEIYYPKGVELSLTTTSDDESETLAA